MGGSGGGDHRNDGATRKRGELRVELDERMRELLERLLAQTHDHAVILLDPDGVIVAWFGATSQVFGYDVSEVVGRRFDLLFTPEDVERGVHEHELQVARAIGRQDDDRWMLRKDGSYFWAIGVVTRILDDDGNLVGFGKVLRDRTDLKTKTRALENRGEVLADADRRRNNFLAVLAHELRNPLAPIVNAMHILKSSCELPGPAQTALDIIDRQVRSLERLVGDLVDTARIDSGKVDLDLQVLDLNQVVKTSVASCRSAAEARRHTLEPILVDSPMVVRADPERLQQVFLNLLNNAIKYTPDGGRIWVTATTEGDDAVVRVRDTGVGISAEMLPKVFDLFTQEDSSRHRSGGGLGLGLPVVRNLVALHGGTVQVRSEGADRGSEFVVRLPLYREAQRRESLRSA
jgi:PAS domain S-box-containing protein